MLLRVLGWHIQQSNTTMHRTVQESHIVWDHPLSKNLAVRDNQLSLLKPRLDFNHSEFSSFKKQNHRQGISKARNLIKFFRFCKEMNANCCLRSTVSCKSVSRMDGVSQAMTDSFTHQKRPNQIFATMMTSNRSK